MGNFLDELNPIARKEIMAIYESVYLKLVKKYPRFHYLFWRGKDNIRYYNEVLNELNNQNRRSVNYPRITDKVLLILILTAMLYNSGPQPDLVPYRFLSALPCLYPFYFLFVETIEMRKGNRLPLEFRRFYEGLDTFTSMVPSNNDERLGYQKLKIRLIASLDKRQSTVHIIILLLDILINCVMIAVSILILYIRAENGYKTCYHDSFSHIFSCIFSMGFTLLYLLVCVKNWIWLQKFKLELICKDF